MRTPKRQEPPCKFAERLLWKIGRGRHVSTDRQPAGRHGEEQNDTGENDIKDGKGHGCEKVKNLRENLHPIALGRVVLSIDPVASGRQLQGQHHQRSSESDAGQDFRQPATFIDFLFLICLHRRHL